MFENIVKFISKAPLLETGGYWAIPDIYELKRYIITFKKFDPKPWAVKEKDTDVIAFFDSDNFIKYCYATKIDTAKLLGALTGFVQTQVIAADMVLEEIKKEFGDDFIDDAKRIFEDFSRRLTETIKNALADTKPNTKAESDAKKPNLTIIK